MKRIFALFSFTLLLFASCSSKLSENFTSLTEENHPRLMMDDREFAKLHKIMARGKDSIVVLMHEAEMKVADSSGMSADTLKYVKDMSGRRILSVSRSAMNRIISCAYAYRFTGDKKYLAHAEWDINTVCDFPDWNPSHYLDVAEMAAAVAFGYDWLYDGLSPETKAKAERTLKQYTFDTSPGQSYFKMVNNWNQVCNSGLTVAALAIYETMPETAKAIIDEAVESNRTVMSQLYAPDGIYVEGPAYWNYGSNYQALMLSCLESCTGGDFGLSDVPGFSKTGAFVTAAEGNIGLSFNYYDGGSTSSFRNALWYLADRFGDTGVLYHELETIKNGNLSQDGWARFLPMSIHHALHINILNLGTIPEGPATFSGNGETPMAIFRTGFGRNDIYLAVKGGTAFTNHGHLDAGSFVYEADGERWAVDLGAFDYSTAENGLAKVGGNLWDRNQGSYRWDIFRYNNRQHSTITVNGDKFLVEGKAELIALSEDPEYMCATFDLTPVYGDALAFATRTAGIRDCDHLEIKDVLKTPDEKDAEIRWTFVTRAEPQIVPDGIRLSINGKSVKLSTSANGVKWRIWSSNPKDYESRTSFFEEEEKAFFCGFEATVPAGTNWETTTTLKRCE